MCHHHTSPAPALAGDQGNTVDLPGQPPTPGEADWQALCAAVADAFPARYRLPTPLDELGSTGASALPAGPALLGWPGNLDPPGAPEP
jgi:hypothetical protein